MAIGRIILLCGAAEAPFLGAILRAHDARLSVEAVTDRAALLAACDGVLTGCRLVSFCSSVVVPAAVLARLPGPAYNFHPGPPEYPGRYPSVFALYDGAARFGVTVHEMTVAVDAGPIVAADWFAVPPDCTLPQLEELAFAALAARFRSLSAHLALVERPLPRMPYRWSGWRTRKADCDALCRLTPGLDAAEIARRRRACGSLLVEQP
jgi:methionyl-tRNA formyltransferase